MEIKPGSGEIEVAIVLVGVRVCLATERLKCDLGRGIASPPMSWEYKSRKVPRGNMHEGSKAQPHALIRADYDSGGVKTTT